MSTLGLERIFNIVRRICVSFNLRKWPFLLFFIQSVNKKRNLSADVLKSILSQMFVDPIEFTASLVPENSNSILRDADIAIEHKFMIFSSNYISNDPIKWNKDINSGYEWNTGTYYIKYRQQDFSNNSDVKVPWEISRCHHFLSLGQAYLLTKDEKYVKEIIVQVNSWIDNNPFMYSINWTCSMEVSIRAVNWMYALNMISSSVLFTDEIARKVTRSLYEHGFFIYNNLENEGRYNANHYMADLVGLIHIGRLFSSFPQGKKWYSFAFSEYLYEIRTQLLPSGFHYERSISYHRLMTEMIAYTSLMLQKIGELLPADIMDRIRRMFDVIEDYQKPNYTIPNIGDEDNGRFLPFIRNDFHNHKYLIDLYRKYFNQDKTTFDSECVKIFDDVGFGLLKKDNIYLFVNNAGLSRYPVKDILSGTHTHCDLLSFELSLGKQDIIIDPGTYTYTSDIKRRNLYRSTAKHNTICVDGIEQYSFNGNAPFAMINNAYPLSLTALTRDGADIISGSYAKNVGEMRFEHFRKINYKDKVIIIYDSITFNGLHSAKLYYHFAPDLEIIQDKHEFAVISSSNNLKMSFEATDYKICIVDDKISPSYGVEKETKTLVLSTDFCDSCIIKTIIKM